MLLGTQYLSYWISPGKTYLRETNLVAKVKYVICPTTFPDGFNWLGSELIKRDWKKTPIFSIAITYKNTARVHEENRLFVSPSKSWFRIFILFQRSSKPKNDSDSKLSLVAIVLSCVAAAVAAVAASVALIKRFQSPKNQVDSKTSDPVTGELTNCNGHTDTNTKRVFTGMS